MSRARTFLRSGVPVIAFGRAPEGAAEIVVLAIALALDATAANAGVGASRGPIVLAAVLFGVFQAGMAGFGLVGGTWLVAIASAWDHWIAFALLVGIGGQMIRKASTDDGADDPPPTGGARLLLLALATSVDAAASGLTLPLLKVPGAVSVAVIGVVTAGLALAGGLVGRWAGTRIGGRLEVVAGVMLIGIGVRILAEHTGWLG